MRRDEGKLCFVKRKTKDLVSNCRILCEKNVSFFENRESRIKTCGHSFETPLLFYSFSPLVLKRHPFLRPQCHPRFPHMHSLTRERTRPCASRTQRVRHSSLHFHSQFVDIVRVACEGKALFFFTGEGNWGEMFTRKSLIPSFLQSYGDEVKEKNEKQRSRALRVRVGG